MSVNLRSFEIIRISSRSDHPVRNTANELIFGNHILWEGKNMPVEEGGSLAPNVFSYNFTSSLSSNSTLNVTLKVVDNDSELFGIDLVLRGSLSSSASSKIFESRAFTIRNAEETTITVAVCIVDPKSSPNPFSLNGDFTWTIVPKDSDGTTDSIEYSSLDETRLELYWVSPNIHKIFYAGLSGIAINFLRAVFFNNSTDPSHTSQSTLLDWPQVVQQVFSNFNKTYDTVEGAAHFGVTFTGGNFDHKRYVEGNPQGSAYPVVNCDDQAAMVQVLGTLAEADDERPSWLFSKYFGYINTTSIVGIPGPCNNPFFASNGSAQLVDINDPNRTPFRSHTFNGHLLNFNPIKDIVYDACSGPIPGTYNPEGYFVVAIDRETKLYNPEKKNRPGTMDDIREYDGVYDDIMALPRPITLEVGENGEKLLEKYASGNTEPFSQVHWGEVPHWAKTVLGDNCDVVYHQTDIGDGIARLFWHLTGIEGFDGDVVVKVRVETYVDADGKLDYQRSSRIAFDDLLSTLLNVDLDLGPNYERLYNIWAPTPFGKYAKYALQYASHIPRGCILILSGNVLIDISGKSSSKALEPVVHKLLAHTTITTPASLHIPRVSEHFYEIQEESKGLNSPSEVKDLFTSFDIKCHVDEQVAAASAHVEGHGILLSKYRIDKNETNKTSTVTFTFVTRTVGVHDVHLRFKKALTMTTGTKKVQVTVVDV